MSASLLCFAPSRDGGADAACAASSDEKQPPALLSPPRRASPPDVVVLHHVCVDAWRSSGGEAGALLARLTASTSPVLGQLPTSNPTPTPVPRYALPVCATAWVLDPARPGQAFASALLAAALPASWAARAAAALSRHSGGGKADDTAGSDNDPASPRSLWGLFVGEARSRAATARAAAAAAVRAAFDGSVVAVRSPDGAAAAAEARHAVSPPPPASSLGAGAPPPPPPPPQGITASHQGFLCLSSPQCGAGSGAAKGGGGDGSCSASAFSSASSSSSFATRVLLTFPPRPPPPMAGSGASTASFVTATEKDGGGSSVAGRGAARPSQHAAPSPAAARVWLVTASGDGDGARLAAWLAELCALPPSPPLPQSSTPTPPRAKSHAKPVLVPPPPHPPVSPSLPVADAVVVAIEGALHSSSMLFSDGGWVSASGGGHTVLAKSISSFGSPLGVPGGGAKGGAGGGRTTISVEHEGAWDACDADARGGGELLVRLEVA